MSNQNFRATGNAVLVAASSSTGLAATQISSGNSPCAWLSNPTTTPIYAAFGSSSIAAGVPTTAAPAPGLCVPGGMARVFNVGPAAAQSWLSAVTSAGSAQLFAQPGVGQ